jgi:hypothetical protein
LKGETGWKISPKKVRRSHGYSRNVKKGGVPQHHGALVAHLQSNKGKKWQ